MRDPDALVAELLEACATGQPLQPPVREWLQRGFLALIEGQAGTLEAGLGLQRPGGGQSARLSRRMRLAARAAHLADALVAVAADPAAGRWDRCQRVAGEVQRLQRRPLSLVEPPRVPAVRWHLWHAWRAGVGLPWTAEGIHRATAATVGCSRSAAALTVAASLPTAPPPHDADHPHQRTD